MIYLKAVIVLTIALAGGVSACALIAFIQDRTRAALGEFLFLLVITFMISAGAVHWWGAV